MELVKVSATLPPDIVALLDKKATDWLSNRSRALTRIVLEWSQSQAEQLPLAVADDPQETPTEQMKKNGAVPLVEA